MTADSTPVPPADPFGITLTYRHAHRWWFDADDAPESWSVSADVFDDSGTQVLTHVADMHIVIVDLFDTRDPFSLLDDESADLGTVAGVIFDPGSSRLAPDLEQQLEPLGDRVLILDSVRLPSEWRGFGLGALLAGTAIKKLSGGVRAAVCYPAPINDHNDDELPEAENQRARAVLGRVWGQLGFEHFRGGVYVIDLNLITLDENLQHLRKTAERHRCGD